MKKIFIGLNLLLLTACHDLDLNPLASGSTETWYSNEKEVEMAVNNLYAPVFWSTDGDDWSDDEMYRESLTPFQNATLTSETSTVKKRWETLYKKISRANGVIINSKRAIENGASESVINIYMAEARFARATAYAELINKFGDVPLVVKDIDINEGLSMGRTPMNEVKDFVYKEFDEIAEILPVECKGIQRATKGAALAYKARYALYFKDYELAAKATKQVMDLDVYSLHPSYRDLFLPKTKNAKESIFLIPRSIEYNSAIGTTGKLPRNFRGYAAPNPTWDLMASYPCTDGLPIDESPLFDSHNPFLNRDPRLSQTIIPFGENFLGVEYNPHPLAKEVMDFRTGKLIKNNDTRTNTPYAAYNGLLYKKGIDESALENGKKIDPDMILMRYADVLLMYAEAKIELGQIDQSVVDAMNQVRARAYGVDAKDVDAYPEFTIKDQKSLRKEVRVERRIELADEGLRYMDLMRWRLMDKAMSKSCNIMLYPTSLLIEQIVNKGEWFWPYAPEIDEDGLADFSKMENEGKVGSASKRQWDERQYLWPIPSTEILINPNMKQNPGY